MMDSSKQTRKKIKTPLKPQRITQFITVLLTVGIFNNNSRSSIMDPLQIFKDVSMIKVNTR